jgi:hypothetical protein
MGSKSMSHRDGPPAWFDRRAYERGGRNKETEMVEIAGDIRASSEKAIQFYDGRKTFWLPRSQIEIDDDGTIWCAEWLAKDKGLI